MTIYDSPTFTFQHHQQGVLTVEYHTTKKFLPFIGQKCQCGCNCQSITPQLVDVFIAKVKLTTPLDNFTQQVPALML